MRELKKEELNQVSGGDGNGIQVGPPGVAPPPPGWPPGVPYVPVVH